MIVKIQPDIKQVRWQLERAAGAFETLDRETATEIALAEIKGLLEYLESIDRANNAAASIELRDGKPNFWFKQKVY